MDDDLLLTEHINEAPMPTEPRRMNFILIGLCTQGQVEYHVDTEKQIIKPGDLLVVSERHVVDHYRPSADMKGLCMIVSVDFFHEVIQNVRDVSSLFLLSRKHPVMALQPKEIETFKEYFTVVKQKINDADNLFRKDLIRTLLLAMFYDLSNVIHRVLHHPEKQSRSDVIFTDFIKLVEQNFRTERRVSWYAQQLCITPKYLSESIKSVSAHTPNEWIDNYVLMEMRLILKNTTKNIKEITEELHFPNQSFLGKYFREHMGMSPTKYRKS
ncbi:MAG: AraC family transcriptional regulator [Prevotella sp.]|nr:AraC family transcriptional regulator [Prevotella sp.]